MRKIALDPRTLAALPALAGVLRSPEWRGLIRYVGSRDAEPVVWIQSLPRHACDGPPDPQTALHADTFHPTVKAWLFLTDVAADAGPFTYVPGSHRLTPQRLAWERRMSLAAPDFAGRRHPAGLVPRRSGRVARDGPARAARLRGAGQYAGRRRHVRLPCARPEQPGRSLRVEIWAYGRRSPFVPWAGFDPWTGAALARRSLVGWRLGDLLRTRRHQAASLACAPACRRSTRRPSIRPNTYRRPARMAWDPAQYLKFAGPRLRPALDLLQRIDVEAPATRLRSRGRRRQCDAADRGALARGARSSASIPRPRCWPRPRPRTPASSGSRPISRAGGRTGRPT